MYKLFVDYELIKIRFGEILDINIYFYFIQYNIRVDLIMKNYVFNSDELFNVLL